MKAYINSLNIHKCKHCEDIRTLQSSGSRNINVAPVFWQGQGVENIPLVIMGINPSVVGTTNEPQREDDFDHYYDYYQNRRESENQNVFEAREGGFLNRIPRSYWTRCHNLAKHLIGESVKRWEKYILMEAIHCFYNKESDLNAEQTMRVAEECFQRHTKKMLIYLNPQMIVLFGKAPYLLLRKYLDRPVEDYQFCGLYLDALRVPVLRHPHPTGFNSGSFYRIHAYKQFQEYRSRFDSGL